MKIPKKLKIGGHTFKVRYSKDIEPLGETSRTKGEIVLDPELIQSVQESTFIHEIFHVLNSELNHTVLDSLAEQLYQVPKDNNLLK